MIIYGILVFLLLITCLLLAILLRRGDEPPQNIFEVLQRSRAVDLQAFQNLVDQSEEQYLRSQLSPSEYRRVQRKRMRAALVYVRATLHNSKVLLAFGQAARASADPATAKAGFDLVQSALRLRIYSLLAIGVFGFRIVFPSVPVSCSWLMNSYERMRDCAGGLVRIEGPAYASRIEAAI